MTSSSEIFAESVIDSYLREKIQNRVINNGSLNYYIIVLEF